MHDTLSEEQIPGYFAIGFLDKHSKGKTAKIIEFRVMSIFGGFYDGTT